MAPLPAVTKPPLRSTSTTLQVSKSGSDSSLLKSKSSPSASTSTSSPRPEMSIDAHLAWLIDSIKGTRIPGSISAQTKESWEKRLLKVRELVASLTQQNAQLTPRKALHSSDYSGDGSEFESMGKNELVELCLKVKDQEEGDFVQLHRCLLNRACDLITQQDQLNLQQPNSEPNASEETRLNRIESSLSNLAKENSELKVMLVNLCQQSHQCNDHQTASQVNLAAKRPIQVQSNRNTSSTNEQAWSKKVSKSMSKKIAKQAANQPNKANKSTDKPTLERTPTIRIKPKADSSEDGIDNLLDKGLKETPLPEHLDYSDTKLLGDGSKVIYTNNAEGFREFLQKIPTITVMDEVSFQPRIKILSVPNSTDDEVVELALKATVCRQLKSLKRNGGRSRHLVYEVDPETFKRLVGGRVYLPTLSACRVIECTDAPMCTHCLKPGHSQANCHWRDAIPNPLCAKCKEQGHKSTDCDAETKCCANCFRAKRKNTQHSAFDQRLCPELQKYVQWRKNHTDYGL